jgi:hypothetical protein
MINTVCLNVHIDWGQRLSKSFWKFRNMSEGMLFFGYHTALMRALQQNEQHKGRGALLPKAFFYVHVM